MTPIWLLLGIVVITQAHAIKKIGDDDDVTTLVWPRTFYLKALRTSLTDNVVENYEIWKTSKQSRIDYNDGYVKSIVVRQKPYRYGITYAVHPEATSDQEVQEVCTGSPGTRYERASAETILPDDPDLYQVVGNETINDKETVKFTYDSVDSGTDSRRTIWAAYEDDNWVPIKYEVMEFSEWLGSKDKHEIWYFYEYENTFDSKKAFDVESYNCTADVTAIEETDPIRNLLFVNPENDNHVHRVFTAYKQEFSKNYNDRQEHNLRKSIFKKNLRRVIQHNRQNLGYKLGLNQFADKTSEERNKYQGLLRRPEGKVGDIPFPYDEVMLKDLADDLPAEYDLRLEGLVSEVKNQEDCGSCWTFGTTAAVEGALARINGGKLLALSNQALVDCAWAFGAYGCDGGSDNSAYEWMKEYGLPTVSEYGSYMNTDGPCKILNMTTKYPIRGYTDVTPLSIGALKVAVINHGPLSVSVDVTDAFSLYSSGIFYDTTCTTTRLNHEVTLVGYGEKDDETFWILKNSWGPTWGVGGYMFISARDNNCGVATEPTYVVF